MSTERREGGFVSDDEDELERNHQILREASQGANSLAADLSHMSVSSFPQTRSVIGKERNESTETAVDETVIQRTGGMERQDGAAGATAVPTPTGEVLTAGAVSADQMQQLQTFIVAKHEEQAAQFEGLLRNIAEKVVNLSEAQKQTAEEQRKFQTHQQEINQLQETRARGAWIPDISSTGSNADGQGRAEFHQALASQAERARRSDLTVPESTVGTGMGMPLVRPPMLRSGENNPVGAVPPGGTGGSHGAATARESGALGGRRQEGQQGEDPTRPEPPNDSGGDEGGGGPPRRPGRGDGSGDPGDDPEDPDGGGGPRGGGPSRHFPGGSRWGPAAGSPEAPRSEELKLLKTVAKPGVWNHEKTDEYGSLDTWIASVEMYLRVTRSTSQDCMDTVFGRLAPITREALNDYPPMVGDFNPQRAAFDELFKRMRSCFAGEGQTSDAILRYDLARQQETETPEMWRYRLEKLARKAYGVGITQRMLLDRYINGLVHPRYVAAVGERFPETMADAVMYARNVMTLIVRQQHTYLKTEPTYLRAIMQIYTRKLIPEYGAGSLKHLIQGGGGAVGHTINEMKHGGQIAAMHDGATVHTTSNSTSVICFTCHQPGHRKAKCPYKEARAAAEAAGQAWHLVAPYATQTVANQTGRSSGSNNRGRGGRGGGRGRRGGRGGSSQSRNTIGQVTEDNGGDAKADTGTPMEAAGNGQAVA